MEKTVRPIDRGKRRSHLAAEIMHVERTKAPPDKIPLKITDPDRG